MPKTRCLGCNRSIQILGTIRHLTVDFIPKSFKTNKCKVIRFYCFWDDCKLKQYQLQWNQNNDKKSPQKLSVLDDAYWNQAQSQRPNRQDENPNETSHCQWTDEVSLTTGSNFIKVLKRERLFTHLLKSEPDRFSTAETNRLRIEKLLKPIKDREREEWRALLNR